MGAMGLLSGADYLEKKANAVSEDEDDDDEGSCSGSWSGPDFWYYGLQEVESADDEIRTEPEYVYTNHLGHVTLHYVDLLPDMHYTDGPDGRFWLYGVQSMEQSEIDRIMTVVDKAINGP
ncbi:hypothetical protein FRB95_010212 [Tulasnella sp. JGI-2019a]|nr:hypothetical protein FRB95_010212 [Tulasnella sp. JGI-2019a]